MEKLGSLKPSFKENGTVTAGNSSPLSDGAAALLLTSRKKAETLHLKPLARIVASAAAGVHPSYMGMGPVPATQKALKRAGLTMDKIDLVEINEAFASVALRLQRDLDVPDEKLNVVGGAIAMGHPLGATGGCLVSTMLDELERRKLNLALICMCVGGGMGIASIIERV
jgi:acetyl-CoA C-acetyltransferase